MKRRDREAVRALLDGELDASAQAALRRRAAQEPELGAYLAMMEGTRQVLRALPEPSGGPRPFVVPQKNRSPRGMAWLAWLTLPVAAALVVGFWPRGRPLQIEAPGIAVELKFQAPEAREVQVAGDFNGWQPAPLKREGEGWATQLRLPPGRYAYMYVVDGRWTADPEAHSFRDDEFGRQNAVLHL